MNEQELQKLARKMAYPPPPDIEFQHRSYSRTHRWQWVTVITLIIVVVLGALIEPVRAAVVDVLEIGGIRIEIGEQDTTSAPQLVLVGETTLQEAQQAVEYDLKFPKLLGLPQAVYLQEGLVVLRWEDVALYQFQGRGFFKGTPVIEYVNVKGSDVAAWIETPHLLWFTTGDQEQQQQAYLVEGNVLIWEQDNITYRLESNLSKSEVIALAESLANIP
jgi:hypothetical protein